MNPIESQETSEQSIESPAPEVAAVEVAPDAAAPAEPKTPAELARESRLKGEERARLKRVKAKSDELHRQRQEFAAQQQAWHESRKGEDAKRDAEIAALRKQLEGNPLLREGVDTNGILKEFVEQGTPEGEIRALRKRLEDQEKSFAARFDELHNATRTRQEEEQRRLEAIQQTQDENTFHSFAAWIGAPENAKEFPHLNAVYSADEIRQQARAVADWAKRNKRVYTGRQVAVYLEKTAETEYKSREDRRLAFFGNPQSASAPAGKAPIKATPPVPGHGQPRINKSVQRAMTKEEEEAHDLALLRKATKADAIARGNT